MKILIMDDSPDKRSQIMDVLTNMCGLSETEIDQADDLNKGRKLLFAQQYDLLILDLVLPVNLGDEIIPERGVRFIEEFDRYARLNKPLVIIGLTAFEDQYEQMKQLYDEKLWDLIQYQQRSLDWKNTLQRAVQKVNDLRISIFKSIQDTDRFDVGIICATGDEYTQMEKAFNHQWQDFATDASVGMKLKMLELLNSRGETCRLISCCCDQHGMTATATVATCLYTRFGVREIYMTGYCAGFPDQTNEGDLVVATSEYDYLSARLTEEGGEVQSQHGIPFTIPCSNILRTEIEAYVRDKDYPFTIHVSSAACGPRLVVDEPLLMESLLKRDPQLRGIDSDGFGLYSTQYMLGGDRSCLLIKGIARQGDDDEARKSQNESAYKSAQFLYGFLKGA